MHSTLNSDNIKLTNLRRERDFGVTLGADFSKDEN